MEHVGYALEKIHRPLHTGVCNHLLGNPRSGTIRVPIYATISHGDSMDGFADKIVVPLDGNPLLAFS